MRSGIPHKPHHQPPALFLCCSSPWFAVTQPRRSSTRNILRCSRSEAHVFFSTCPAKCLKKYVLCHFMLFNEVIPSLRIFRHPPPSSAKASPSRLFSIHASGQFSSSVSRSIAYPQTHCYRAIFPVPQQGRYIVVKPLQAYCADHCCSSSFKLIPQFFDRVHVLPAEEVFQPPVSKRVIISLSSDHLLSP